MATQVLRQPTERQHGHCVGELVCSNSSCSTAVTMDSGGAEAGAELVQELQQRVQELERKLRHREELLAAERERSTQARKKAKQLFAKIIERDAKLAERDAKLAERDRVIADLYVKLATDKAAAAAPAASAVAAGTDASASCSREELGRSNAASSSARPSQWPHKDKSSTEAKSPVKRGLTRRNLVAQERLEIVEQLERHLAQMRANLAECEREVRELEGRRQAKEAEWSGAPESTRSAEGAQRLHLQALGMIGDQIEKKQRFAAELAQKMQDFVVQVDRRRADIEASRCGGDGGGMSSEADAGREEGQIEAALDGGGPQEQGPCEDEALHAFLAAAGDAAAVILERPVLRAAFETRPPQLSADAIDLCGPEERTQVLSLFTAWVAVAGDPPHAMRMTDIALSLADVEEVQSALEACGAQLEEWEMTRCPANEATVRALAHGLTTQPLRQLNLSYNALGHAGAAALVGALPAWAASLEGLSLEMNGLGDAGCRDIAGALARGALPGLRTLELGWNELSAACAPVLAALLAGAQADGSVPHLQKLGLGGNTLESDGAQAIALAALSYPTRELELDLSMNHVGSRPLLALTEWVEACDAGIAVAVSINLEWNIVDDVGTVRRLAGAIADKALRAGRCGGGQHQPLARLGNNELADMEPSEVLAQSRGLISC